MASSSSTSFGDEIQLPAAAPSPVVTTCLHLKLDAAPGRSLDRDAVLRRIRRQKRVNLLQTALRLEPAAADKDAEPNRWLDDAFSSP
ncbi:hypothetical protein Cni_G16572 [Canna indica]|uniref:Uncharacterized protein n=1 Tax=Canna indica TaxID=4628 RepID=A0AAQ3KIX2_9LILI|nr:hypothetical protein Cni_G16572 [Canna indica]